MSSVNSNEDLTRRQWLARFFWVANAVVAAAVAVPLIGYFLGPLLRRRVEVKVRLGRIDAFLVGRPQRVEFALRRRDGWATEEGRQAAWVMRRASDVLVFDPRCTHLSCAYHWEDSSNQFLCPCHNGLYDSEGRVAGGPPPRPLDIYRTTIEDGVLFIVPNPVRRS